MKQWKNQKVQQRNKWTNAWMNEWMKKWLWEKVGFRDKVWREYRMSTENYWAKWCVSFFHQTDGTISVPTWMMGLWFSQHPTYSGFPSNFDCWRVCLVIINTQPLNMYNPSYWRQLVPVLIAQWRSGFFGAVENAAFWTWCLFFSSLFISLSGEKACKLQPCSILKE